MRAASGPFGRRVEALAETLPGLLEGDVEALHFARVTCRRLREVLPLLPLRKKKARKLDRRLRRLSSRAGRVRELDVLAALVRQLESTRKAHRGALSLVERDVAHARAAQRGRLSERLPPERVERLMRGLVRAAKRSEGARTVGGQAWWRALEARIARRARRLQAAVQAAGTTAAPRRLHRVRLAVKRLRYALELAAEQRRQRPTPELKVLATAQELLGDLHDREVLMDRVARLDAPPAGRRALEALVRAVEHDCRPFHAGYLRQRSALLALARTLAHAPRSAAARGAA